eukprot:TRINITY_DN20787_c0_g1_i1.p1 TRINITY_DN20787_c0_g1~~TRINITY_DN20787_c0_g1_i1.p1  ORF type:complete len:562 (+),score=84.99 TRINITY_DN20787_c0_g1_i1:589-2274(+)
MSSRPVLWQGLLSICFSVLLLASQRVGAQQAIRLGFLTPYPEADAAIPVRLANEWIAALRIALVVLEKEYPEFTIETYVQNSACNAESAEAAALKLVRSGVVGVVGPACSEAALGATTLLGQYQIPMISFAATASKLGDRSKFPYFFRTSLNDTLQATAAVAMANFFHWTSLFMLYSEDSYGEGIKTSMQYEVLKHNSDFPSNIITIEAYPVPTTVPSEGYKGYFNSLNATGVVVLGVLPKVAEGIWLAALELGALKYPWWYFGLDGATAFDVIGEGETYRELAYNLQGEIGIYPFKGNLNSNACKRFTSNWANQSYHVYPGLLTFPRYPRFTETRSYVPQLIDAVQAFHVAFKNIIDAGQDVTASSVFTALSDSAFTFEGCSGTVKFLPNSGERDLGVKVPAYPLVSLISTTWKTIGRWSPDGHPTVRLSVESLSRPGTADVVTAVPNTNVTVTNNATNETATGPISSDVANIPLSPSSAFSASDYEIGSGPPPSPPVTSPPSPVTITYDTSSSGSGSSSGTIMAIAIPLMIIAVLLGVGIYVYVQKRKQESSPFVRMMY